MLFRRLLTKKSICDKLTLRHYEDKKELKVDTTNNVKKKKSLFLKLIPIYVLCVLILFSYLFILFLRPDVCIEYKMYYIDKVLEDWPGYGGLGYDLGDTVFFGENQANQLSERRGSGWAPREDAYCFTDGKEASVYFVIEKQASLDLTLSVKEIVCASYSVYANGTLIGEDLTHKNTSFTLKIPKDAIKEGLLEVTFKINEPSRLSEGYKTGKTGLFGIQVESATLTESK